MEALVYFIEMKSNHKPTLKNHSKINIPYPRCKQFCSKGLKILLKIDGFDRYLKKKKSMGIYNNKIK